MKNISVRIDDDMYYKLKNHELTNSDIIRKSLNQYFRKTENNEKLDTYINENYKQQLEIQKEIIEHLKKEINDWKTTYLANLSMWQLLKLKILRKQPKLLNGTK